MIETIVLKCGYKDSIFLMKATKEMLNVEGVKEAVVVMGTDMNKTVLAEFGGLNEEAKNATPSHLIISLDVVEKDTIQKAAEHFKNIIKEENVDEKSIESYSTLSGAARSFNNAKVVFISTPGEYAALEAKTAINNGLNAFIFSDNVSLEDEVAIKTLAEERNLWVMGPGCGNSVINNVSYGLMSKVAIGGIGIVGASGSGIHEIAALATQKGEGISQAIGTGGRDLSQAVSGITMLRGINYLENDPATKVIVLVSKPPHPNTEKKILSRVLNCKKPVVIFFLGGDEARIKESGAYCAKTLEQAAEIAVKLIRGERVELDVDFIAKCRSMLSEQAEQEKQKLQTGQKYLRGIYCGGTHNEEAILLLKSMLGEVHANVNFGGCTPLESARISIKHSVIDVGDEEFTKGKPHPVMDPSILNDRLWKEGTDPDVGVVLFDLLLGYGAHENPVGAIEEKLIAIKAEAKKQKRHISLVASVTGTDLDPQVLTKQQKRLEELGVIVLPSNAQAAILSGLIIQ